MSGRTLALTGVPRGGTTLACRLLGLCDQTVALFEPMEVGDLSPDDPQAALDTIAAFCDQARAQILQSGTAPSKQRGGRVPDNPFGDERLPDGRRRQQTTRGEIAVEPRPAPGFTLVIKHNAAFAALLPQLRERFQTRAIVRHPLSVLASWNSVDLPVSRGRIPAGERLDAALAAQLQAEPARLRRQLIVLEWFFARFATALAPAEVLRYEDIVATQGQALRASAGLSGRSDAQLTERNASAHYDRAQIAGLAEALLRQPGSWQRWYPPDSVAPLAQRMLQQARAT